MFVNEYNYLELYVLNINLIHGICINKLLNVL